MKKLIKLEWRKNQLGQYIKYAVICTLLIYTATVVMAVLSVTEGEMMFLEYTEFTGFLDMLTRIVFQIFASVLLSRLVIEEYAGKTIQVLFTYPVSRKKLIWGKMLIMALFTFVSILASTVLFGIATYGLQHVFTLYNGQVSISRIFRELPGSILTAVMTTGMSFLPLLVGLKKKTTSSVITSAVLFSLLLNGTVSASGNGKSLYEFVFIPLLLCAIGIAIGYMSMKNIEKADVIGGVK